MKMTYYNGCVKSKVDVRDYTICGASRHDVFPDEYVLDLVKVKNQGGTCSCVAHACSEVMEYHNQKETREYTELSTQFIYGYRPLGYYQGKGMSIRDALKTMHKYGDPTSVVMPGNNEIDDAKKIVTANWNDELLDKAYPFHITSYFKILNAQDLMHALMTYGPVIANMNWHNHSYLDNNNIYRYDDKDFCGCHAVMIYGWNEHGWLVQNSWGSSWGDHGRFVIDYEFDFNELWGVTDTYIANDEELDRPYRTVFGSLLAKVFNAVSNFILLLRSHKEQP